MQILLGKHKKYILKREPLSNKNIEACSKRAKKKQVGGTHFKTYFEKDR